VAIDPAALAAILAMAAATYATRAGGLWLAGRLRLSDRTAAWMRSLPGPLLVAIVAPTVVAAGPAGWLAALATLLVARATGSTLAAMATGVAVTVAARAVMQSP
jgi:uncharacterized membrane protein